MTEHNFSFTNIAKIAFPSLLAVALLIGTFFWVLLPDMHDILLQQKKSLTTMVVQVAKQTLEYYDQEVKTGRLDLATAQQAAINHFRNLRYGSEAKNYFWLNDMQPKMVMHPYRPDLEGLDISSFMDSGGTFLFQKMVETAKNRGSGFIPYFWQWKDTSHKISAKLSYIELFQPWDWIIGTGIYLDDVEEEIRLISRRLHIVSLAVTAIIFLLSLFIIRQRMAETFRRQAAENEVWNYQSQLEKLVDEKTAELEKALQEVKTLSGFLPICTACKKIRNDKGYWDQIEHFISTHSEIEFSHGLCPDCAKKIHPPQEVENQTS